MGDRVSGKYINGVCIGGNAANAHAIDLNV
jgi:hypothetical protein